MRSDVSPNHLRHTRRILIGTYMLAATLLLPLLPAGSSTSAATPGTRRQLHFPQPPATPTSSVTVTATVPVTTPVSNDMATASAFAAQETISAVVTQQTIIPTATPSPTATPYPTATMAAAPTIKAGISSVVHRTNGYQIGAYYFSGWTHGQNNNLTPLLLTKFSTYQPLIGWYDDTQKQVDQNILQASAAGINFFAFDWFDVSRSTYPTDQKQNQALNLFLTSSQRWRMNFCLNFVDFQPFEPRARDWPALVSTWITYFKQPDYARVNGKPLLIIFSPEEMRKIFGGSNYVHAALAYLRARVLKAHLPGVTIAVAATLAPHFNPTHLLQFRTEGYDITTGYNYHSMGGEAYNKPASYSNLVQENEQMWKRVATNLPMPYIPVITSGWDQRFSAREQKTAIIYAGRTPQLFSCYAAAARQWIDQNAKRTVKERMVLVFAWNEIGEGGAIIPTHAYKFSYTTALENAFTAHTTSPTCK